MSARRVPRRDQGLALTAWKLVEDFKSQPGHDDCSEFRTRAMSLPAMLQNSGLAATVAFHRAKSGGEGTLAKAYGAIEKGLEDHLKAAAGAPDGSELIVWLGQTNLSDYRRAAAAARDFAGWVRRAAEALIPKKRPEDLPTVAG